jgi:broad specificity phosphatase PhoE
MEIALDEVLLARHGETEWNQTRRRQGQLDSPLTPDGHGQARRIATVVAGMRPDGVFSSPLGRAHSTAQVVAEETGLGVRVIPELTEVHHGSFAALTNTEIEARYPGELARREEQKYSWRFPDGESYADADRRAGDALELITRSGSSRPAIISHEMLSRMLMRQLLGLDPAEALAWHLPHGSVLRIRPADREVEHLRAG